MEFRLTYEGPLLATQNDPERSQRDNRADHKHDIRKKFHSQLKRLWEITPFLISDKYGPKIRVAASGAAAGHDIRTLSAKHSHYDFNFVPLVTHDIKLYCGLDILFLRPDKPGGVIWAGDIDNRLKTLIDALRMPKDNERYSSRTPDSDERPFFCLLEEDQLITKLAVETDQLLEFVTAETRPSDVRLVITVRIRPYEMHLGNMEFGG